MHHREKTFGMTVTAGIILMFVASLLVGAVDIPAREVWHILTTGEAQKESWRYIIVDSRLPQALTALLAGAALSASGLLLQTTFRNPLAGPGIFGISNGAGLGVALVMLAMGGQVSTATFSVSGFAAILIAAFTGAMAVAGIILFFSTKVRSHVMLLIIGIMVGYLASSAITLLNFAATEEGVRSYMVWGMGDFGGVSWQLMPVFASATLLSLAAALLLIKPLNALLMGEQYAENLGVNTLRVRNFMLLITGLLTAAVTAFCGPIAFIGLAVPHIARLMLGTANHRTLLPMTMLTGSAVALFCNTVCHLPGSAGIIPLNVITPLVGAPIIIYVIAREKA